MYVFCITIILSFSTLLAKSSDIWWYFSHRHLGSVGQCRPKKISCIYFFSCYFLARLFSKKTMRYCHSSGVVWVVVVQKLGHFVISLSLLKIFTWNSDWLFIMERGTHTNRGGNPQNIFGTVMPLFRLRICSRAITWEKNIYKIFFLGLHCPTDPKYLWFFPQNKAWNFIQIVFLETICMKHHICFVMKKRNLL